MSEPGSEAGSESKAESGTESEAEPDIVVCHNAPATQVNPSPAALQTVRRRRPPNGSETGEVPMHHHPTTPARLTIAASLLLLLVAPSASAAEAPCSSIETWGRATSYRGCAFSEPMPRTVEGARSFLAANGFRVGLELSVEDLELVQFKNSLAGTHTRFRQLHDERPVFGTLVSVHQDEVGRVRMVHRSTHSTRQVISGPNPTLSASESEAIARLAAGKPIGETATQRMPSHPELVWFPLDDRRLTLAWQLTVYSDAPLGDFVTVIDATSGALLFQENRIAFDSGAGYAYIPNPYQTSGSGSGMVDNNDATSPALDAERIAATLFGLDAGTGLLKGEFVDLATLNSTSLPDVDADEADRQYFYDRDDPRFEQVVVYHAIDSIQRHFHSLGFDDDTGTPNGIRDFPTLANAHWYSDDQSYYSTGDDAVHFGDGGVDDGEDADIIAHEYGHAVQHDQNASWGGGEMGAMGEGFGDYLAMSFYFSAGDAAYQAANNACVGEWDATSYSGTDPPCLRRTDGSKIYPDDITGSVHADGEIWSRALWDIRAVLGGPATDRIVLEHHFSLPANATMPVAAQEMIAVDEILNGGANESTLRTKFCDRGILSGTACLPPLPTPTITYPAGGEVLTPGGAIDITWEANGAPPDATYVVSYSDQCSSINAVFADDMESGGGNWTATHDAGSYDWALGTDSPYSGSYAWFATDPPFLTDQFLAMTAPITLPPGSVLSVRHTYNTESGFDGGVIEITTGDGTWDDLGPAITQNGYSGSISGDHSSPIAGRDAFTGISGGYIETLVDLSGWSGQDIRVRFRMASDSSVAGVGWHVDDVSITGAVDHPVGTSAAGATSMPWTVPSTPGDDYCIRIQGHADGYSDPPLATGGAFTVGGADDIFTDGFESGDTSEWTVGASK